MKTAVVALSLLMGSTAFAQRVETSGAAFLHHYDRDKDGKVSLEEFRADADLQFKIIDADGDGFATTEEAAAFEQKMREMMQQRRGAASQKQ
ncbi:MAG: hypothetical protein ABFR19_10440 [Pseudomonadota bacterium]